MSTASDSPERAFRRYDMSGSYDMVNVAIGEVIIPFQPLDYSANGLSILVPFIFTMPESGLLEYRGALFLYTVRSLVSDDSGVVVGLALDAVMPSLDDVDSGDSSFNRKGRAYHTFRPSHAFFFIVMSLFIVTSVVGFVALSNYSFRSRCGSALAGFCRGCQFLSHDSAGTWVNEIVVDGFYGIILTLSGVSLDKHLHEMTRALKIRQLELAESAYADRQFEAALRAATKAVELDPSSADALQARGLARLSLGQHAEAVLDLRQALFLDKANVARYQKITPLLCQQRRLTEALEICMQGYKAVPPDGRKAMAALIANTYRAAQDQLREVGDSASNDRLSALAREWASYAGTESPELSEFK